MKKVVSNILMLLCVVFAARAEEVPAPDQSVVYKTVGDVSLKLHLFNPPNHKSSDRTPAIVFFHGGGWQGGGFTHFSGQADYLASRGMVAISAEYRTAKPHGTSPK